MISEVLAGAFVVAVIYILVRPGSQGQGFVEVFGDAMAALVSQVTDIAGDASGERDQNDPEDDPSTGGN